MTRYSVQPWDRIFVKNNEFFPLLKIWVKILVKKWIKIWIVNSENLLDYAKQSATDPFKTASKWAIQKAAEATVDLCGNKLACKIRKVSKKLPDNSETVKNDTLRKIYISRRLLMI